MSDKEYIGPDSTIIQGMRCKGGANWPKMLAELIDNSLDAGANSVTLDFHEPSRLTVTDDGGGCDDLLRIAIYGRRSDHATTTTGMYGVGAKDAIVWVARRATVHSVCGGTRRAMHIDWDKILETNEWLIDSPSAEPTEDRPGTKIVLDGFLREPPPWKDLERSIGATFTSAIHSGVSIAIRRGPKHDRFERIEPAATPDLADEVELILDVGKGGRKAVVKMGILQNPSQQTMQGVTIAMRGGRVLRSRTRVGLGSDHTPGLYGYVEIYPRANWSIHTNKDGIDQRQEDELAAAISSDQKLAALIAKAKARGHDIRLDKVNEVLGLMTDEIVATRKRKARRSATSHPGSGAVPSTGNGVPHTRAAKTQEGQRFSETVRSRGGKITVHVQQCGEDGPLLDVHGSAVTVNSQHPFYSHMDGDMRVIVPLAVAYYAADALAGGQQLIPFLGVEAEKQEELRRQVSAALECLAKAERHAAEVPDAST
jgi:hypothetical protein